MSATIARSTSPPLTHLLTLRVVLLLLTVFMLTLASIAGFVAWQHAKEDRQEDISARHMIDTRLQLLRQSWQHTAESITAGIAVHPIGNQPEPIRRQFLHAWLATLAEKGRFGGTFVMDKDNRILVAQGQESQAIIADPPAGDADWYFSPQQNQLYAVVRSRVWPGQEAGEGDMVFLEPIQTSTLQMIGSDKRPVYLASTNALLAGSDAIPVPIESGKQFTHAEQSWRLVEVPIAGTEAARFLVRLPATLPDWLMPVWLGAIAVGLMLAVGIHLVLGRWMHQLVKRIESLGQAANAFGVAENGHLNEARIWLKKSQDKPDEIAHVADTLERLMHMVNQREEENRAYLDTLNLLEEVVIELDLDGVIQRASSAWPRLSGDAGHRCDMSASRFQDRLHPDDVEQMTIVLAALSSQTKEQITLRARLRGNAASDTWLECRFVPLFDSEVQVKGIRGVLRDVTQTYLQEKQITHMALHDALTGLPNRVLIEDRAKMAIRIASRSQHKVGLCFFDLDHFKQINDSLGHKTGDRLLIAFSEAVKRQLRSGDTLARWGGDEFVLLIPDMKSSMDIREVVSKIAQRSRTPLVIDGAEFAVTFSMGVTIYPDDADHIDVLFSHADRAMFYAKAQGRNTFQFFSDMSQKGLGKKDLYIQHRLASAIQHAEVATWFQPLMDAGTGRPIGVEALARWHDPELGWVSPATFIPMAENLGLIGELGEQVWKATLSAGQRWQAQGFELGLAVNVSKRQLFMPNFSENLTLDAQGYGIPAQRITLEVTESIALLDVEYAAERLNQLSQAGFRIAIDDFGTGYSSLSQLHDMPVNEVKIDISFVRRIHSAQGMRVIQAIIQMARAMHLECIAEGIEDAETADILTNLGVNTLQGFYFGKPMPVEDFTVWLTHRMQTLTSRQDSATREAMLPLPY